MNSNFMRVAGLVVLALGTFAGNAVVSCLSQADPQTRTAGALAKQVGTIKSISGNMIIFTTDNGSESRALVEDSTRMVRIAPGEKDLKNGTPVRLNDLQIGDRILVRGNPGAAGQPLQARGVIVMKLSDLETKQQHDREEWLRRGVAGLVSAVDAANGSVTITTGSFAAKKTVAVHISSHAVLRRYSPESVKFDDAKPAPLAAIKVGDQLRARGTRSPDGSDLTADEIVSGTFRNIAGTINSVDASAGKITVLDLTSKKPVVVKLTTESNVRSLPPEMAKRIAMRMSAGPAGENGGPGAPGSPPAGPRPAGDQTGPRRSGGDIQQMFSRLPTIGPAEMQKGDTVMLVSTQGDASGEVTAINLLDGVEAILAASPKNSEAMNLSPWSLGAQGGEDAAP
jgi:hypothetical protein